MDPELRPLAGMLFADELQVDDLANEVMQTAREAAHCNDSAGRRHFDRQVEPMRQRLYQDLISFSHSQEEILARQEAIQYFLDNPEARRKVLQTPAPQSFRAKQRAPSVDGSEKGTDVMVPRRLPVDVTKSNGDPLRQRRVMFFGVRETAVNKATSRLKTAQQAAQSLDEALDGAPQYLAQRNQRAQLYANSDSIDRLIRTADQQYTMTMELDYTAKRTYAGLQVAGIAGVFGAVVGSWIFSEFSFIDPLLLSTTVEMLQVGLLGAASAIAMTQLFREEFPDSYRIEDPVQARLIVRNENTDEQQTLTTTIDPTIAMGRLEAWYKESRKMIGVCAGSFTQRYQIRSWGLDILHTKQIGRSLWSRVRNITRMIVPHTRDHADIINDLQVNRTIELARGTLYNEDINEELDNVDFFEEAFNDVVYMAAIAEWTSKFHDNLYDTCVPTMGVDRGYIEDLVHPLLGHKSAGITPNTWDESDGRGCVLTGPNKKGKSIFLSACGLATAMAHAGMHVVAKQADIPWTDQILALVPQNTDVRMGESKLTYELHRSGISMDRLTQRTLLLPDETYSSTEHNEGAQLYLDHLEWWADLGARFVASTHMQEAIDLADRHPEMQNIHVEGLYQVRPGPSRETNVQELAHEYGLTDEQIAQTVLERIQSGDYTPTDRAIERVERILGVQIDVGQLASD